MPSRDDLEWWRCNDFSKGIVRAQQRSASSSFFQAGFAPDGTASAAVGCLASPTGALIPGWRVVRVVNQTTVHNSYDSTHRPTDVTGKDFLTGTAILSPVISTYSKTSANRAADGTADQVFTQHTYWYDDTGATHYTGRNLWRTTFWTNATTLGTAAWYQTNDIVNNPGFITGTDARRVRGFMVTGYAAPWNNGTNNFNTTPAVDEPNPRWFVASSAASGENNVDPLLYPDSDLSAYSSMTNDTPIAGAFIAGDFAAYHAGRLVIGGAQGYGLYGKSHLFEGSVAQFDGQYSRPFEMSQKLAAGPIGMQSLLLQDSGLSKIAALCSVNANTLFVQMDTTGGYVIQGDLDRPQVTHLPGIPSAYGYAAIPVTTPKGTVVTSKSGVYTWNQGSTADLISQQLPGDFWINSDWEKQRRHGASKGKLGYSDPYLTVPGGYMCNTTNGSWWQLPQSGGTPGFFHYETASSGQVYAFPEYMDQTNPVSHIIFDPYSVPAGTGGNWTWISNPIAALTPTARDISLREIEIELSGAGTVMVTVTAGSVAYAHQFTVHNASYPIRQRASATIHTSHIPAIDGVGSTAVTVQIQSSGESGSTWPIPAVHSIGLGTVKSTSTKSG